MVLLKSVDDDASEKNFSRHFPGLLSMSSSNSIILLQKYSFIFYGIGDENE